MDDNWGLAPIKKKKRPYMGPIGSDWAGENGWRVRMENYSDHGI